MLYNFCYNITLRGMFNFKVKGEKLCCLGHLKG